MITSKTTCNLGYYSGVFWKSYVVTQAKFHGQCLTGSRFMLGIFCHPLPPIHPTPQAIYCQKSWLGLN